MKNINFILIWSHRSDGRLEAEPFESIERATTRAKGLITMKWTERAYVHNFGDRKRVLQLNKDGEFESIEPDLPF